MSPVGSGTRHRGAGFGSWAPSRSWRGGSCSRGSITAHHGSRHAAAATSQATGHDRAASDRLRHHGTREHTGSTTGRGRTAGSHGHGPPAIAASSGRRPGQGRGDRQLFADDHRGADHQRESVDQRRIVRTPRRPRRRPPTRPVHTHLRRTPTPDPDRRRPARRRLPTPTPTRRLPASTGPSRLAPTPARRRRHPAPTPSPTPPTPTPSRRRSAPTPTDAAGRPARRPRRIPPRRPIQPVRRLVRVGLDRQLGEHRRGRFRDGLDAVHRDRDGPDRLEHADRADELRLDRRAGLGLREPRAPGRDVRPPATVVRRRPATARPLRARRDADADPDRHGHGLGDDRGLRFVADRLERRRVGRDDDLDRLVDLDRARTATTARRARPRRPPTPPTEARRRRAAPPRPTRRADRAVADFIGASRRAEGISLLAGLAPFVDGPRRSASRGAAARIGWPRPGSRRRPGARRRPVPGLPSRKPEPQDVGVKKADERPHRQPQSDLLEPPLEPLDAADRRGDRLVQEPLVHRGFPDRVAVVLLDPGGDRRVGVVVELVSRARGPAVELDVLVGLVVAASGRRCGRASSRSGPAGA